jgi:CheY-like chemotaxis protein
VLPDQSGLGLCRIVRESPVLAATPIIVLTSRASEIDRVLAFESGVDDFLAKPFYPPELGARVSAVLRGFVAHAEEHEPGAPAGSAIQLDPRTGRVIADGRRVELTPRERELLSALIAQAAGVVRRPADRPAPGRTRAAQRARSTRTSRASAAARFRAQCRDRARRRISAGRTRDRAARRPLGAHGAARLGSPP